MAWRELRKGDHCPVCDKKTWCGYLDDGGGLHSAKALRCMRFWRDGLDTPPGWRRPFQVDSMGKVVRDASNNPIGRGADEDGGQCFVRDDGQATYRPPALSAAERKAMEESRKRNDAFEARARARQVADALGVWRKAKGGDAGIIIGTAPACLDGSGADHPRARAYFEARGIKMEWLPGGKLPPSVRYLGQTQRGYEDAAGKKQVELVPAVLGAFSSAERKVTAVQRIYLDPAGEPKKGPRPDDPESAKKALGSLSTGQAIKLSQPDQQGGVLIIAEGLETALACLAARGAKGSSAPTAAVWCVVSTSGMKSLKLVDGDVRPDAGGWVRTVIIAADLDRAGRTGKRPGSDAARVLQARLEEEWPEIAVRLALPSHKIVPKMVDEQGEIVQPAEGDGAGGGGGGGGGGRKSVDWLDVLAEVGPAAMAAELIPAGIEFRKRLLLPPEGSRRAQIVLRRVFSPPRPAGAVGEGGAWRIARFAGEWWIYWTGRRPRWKKVDDMYVRARMREVLDEYWVSTAKSGLKPAALTDRTVDDILKAMVMYTGVMADRMPAWLPSIYGKDGRPEWKSTVRWHEEDHGESPADLAQNFLSFPNGLLNLAEFKAGRVALAPPSPRLFTASCLPWKFPDDLFTPALMADRDALHETVAARCPDWINFLTQVTGADEERMQALQRWFGYVLLPSNWLEKLCWLRSPPGSGKSTILDVFTAMLGFENVAPIEPQQLGSQFSGGPMVGKMFYPMDEFRVGRQTDAIAVLDKLLKIASGAVQAVEDKFMKRSEPLVLPGKIMIASNGFPAMSDPSAAIVRRILMIPLEPLDPAQRDETLKARLVAQAEHVLAWALVGMRDLMLEGAFTQPQAGKALIEELEEQQSPVKAFAKECLIVDPGSSVVTDLLFSRWEAWCEEGDRSERSVGDKALLGRRLSEIYGVKREQVHGERNVRQWLGVRLRFDGEGGNTAQDTCVSCRQWPAWPNWGAPPKGWVLWPADQFYPQPPFRSGGST